jgi:hypothetical protein
MKLIGESDSMKAISRIALVLVVVLLFLIALVLFVVFPLDSVNNATSFSELTGPYLGQKTPGETAERFAPSIFQEELHTTTVFSPDGKEVYWRPMGDETSNEILFMRLEDTKWTSSHVVPFASRFFDSDDPCISPDGEKMFFTSWRPITWYTIFDLKERIWYVERTERGWSRPKAVGSAINSMDLHWQLSVSESGSLYFASDGDIYYSQYEGGQYQEPRRLGTEVNTPAEEGLPFIALDESYLLFSSNGHPDQVGDYDLFVSVRRMDGLWSKAMNLGEGVNSRYQELYPVVSPEEEYLFFLSNREGMHSVYWVDFARVKSLISEYSGGG